MDELEAFLLENKQIESLAAADPIIVESEPDIVERDIIAQVLMAIKNPYESDQNIHHFYIIAFPGDANARALMLFVPYPWAFQIPDTLYLERYYGFNIKTPQHPQYVPEGLYAFCGFIIPSPTSLLGAFIRCKCIGLDIINRRGTTYYIDAFPIKEWNRCCNTSCPGVMCLDCHTKLAHSWGCSTDCCNYFFTSITSQAMKIIAFNNIKVARCGIKDVVYNLALDQLLGQVCNLPVMGHSKTCLYHNKFLNVSSGRLSGDNVIEKHVNSE
jgi:hypothetical protein